VVKPTRSVRRTSGFVQVAFCNVTEIVSATSWGVEIGLINTAAFFRYLSWFAQKQSAVSALACLQQPTFRGNQRRCLSQSFQSVARRPHHSRR
jgi:hypothetical protein